ncbi:hypothetical protein M422DRAFT_44514 [Sphaerobolus stellatus SS14]|nr:hypothetical protein M422DRAFT_44514 [Sphaerobolus stellatus SS14]
MARRKKVELAEFWEENSTDSSHIHCKHLQVNAATKWLSYQAYKTHESSKNHQENVETLARAQEEEQEERAKNLDIHDLRALEIFMEDRFYPPQLDTGDADTALQIDDQEWLWHQAQEELYYSESEESIILEEDIPTQLDSDIHSKQVAANTSDFDRQNENWFPYPSKIMFLLDLLDSLPRLRLSRPHLQLFMWVLKELRVPNVLSVDQLRSMQEKLRDKCGGIETKLFQSDLGNIFYCNDLSRLIAQISTIFKQIYIFILIYSIVPGLFKSAQQVYYNFILKRQMARSQNFGILLCSQFIIGMKHSA